MRLNWRRWKRADDRERGPNLGGKGKVGTSALIRTKEQGTRRERKKKEKKKKKSQTKSQKISILKIE